MLDRHVIDDWVEYNKTYRFGVGLFVDGKCVYEGYLTKEVCAHIEREREWVRELAKTARQIAK